MFYSNSNAAAAAPVTRLTRRTAEWPICGSSAAAICQPQASPPAGVRYQRQARAGRRARRGKVPARRTVLSLQGAAAAANSCTAPWAAPRAVRIFCSFANIAHLPSRAMRGLAKRHSTGTRHLDGGPIYPTPYHPYHTPYPINGKTVNHGPRQKREAETA
jgi:hypothetical protein